MRDGSEPGHNALLDGGGLHHLAGVLRDIELGPGRVAEAVVMHGARAVDAVQGPLVHGDHPQVRRQAGQTAGRGQGVGGAQGLRRGHLVDRLAGGEVIGLLVARPGLHVQHRAPGHHLQVEAGQLGVVGQVDGRPRLGRGHGQGRERPQPLALVQSRIALVHHHEAGQAPDGHQQANRHADIAVQDDQQTHEPPGHAGLPSRSGSCS